MGEPGQIINGRGRFIAPRPALTLSGVRVELHRVGPSTLRDIRAAVRTAWRTSEDPDHAEPQPPIVTTEGITEPNLADPDYQRAHREWEGRLSDAVGMRILEFAALFVLELPDEAIDHAAVARYRRAMRIAGTPIPSDDYPELTDAEKERVIFLGRMLIDGGTREEVMAFNRWIYQGQAPTEQEVAEELETFRDPVPGAAADLRDPATAPV